MPSRPYRISNIDEHTFQIDEEGVRFFLLEGTRTALLIDSGMKVHNAKDIASSLTQLPIQLLNTHADPDHIGSIAQFDFFYMHPSEAAHLFNIQKKRGVLKALWDGDTLDLGDRMLKIIALPGHTPGSIAVLDVERRILFSGDAIQQNGNIFMFGPQRQADAYIESLKRLKTQAASFDLIYPSHADCPIAPALIDKHIYGMQDILLGKRNYEYVQVFDSKVRKYNLGFAAFLMD